ncbi:MAG: hypothetical protein KAR16_15260, partial [Bacteroidales bacterium]|nr:hypothetical protein [Bacteroidales bacterium]
MNLGFGTRTTKSDDSEDTSPNKFLNLNLMPKAGYFVADHLVLGIDLSFMALRQTDDGGSLYNYRIQGDIFGYQEDNSSTNWSLKGNANIMVTKQ